MALILIIIFILFLPGLAFADPVSFTAIFVSALISGASFGTALLLTGVVMAMGAIRRIMMGKPKTDAIKRSRTVMVRESAAPRRLIYGKCWVSGVVTDFFASGTDNEYIHLVLALTGHEVESIGDVKFNDTLSSDSRYSGLVRINKHLGGYNQTADSDLVAEITDVTSVHKKRDSAYIYIRFKWDPDAFPSGLPNIKCEVEGKKVWDPRSTPKTIVSSTTPSTITVTSHGYSPGDQIYIKNHNSVPALDGEYTIMTTPTSDTFTLDVTINTDGSGGSCYLMAYSQNAALCQLDYLTNNYYGMGANNERIDETLAIAAANICDEDVALDDPPTLWQDRYTCDGVIFMDQIPEHVMGDMLTSSAGSLIYQGGQYRLYAGAYTAPSVTLDENDLAGNIKATRIPSRRSLFNAVRGVFIDEKNFDQPTDFPPVTNSFYKKQDGGVILWRDVQFPFTKNPVRAQRLAKIILERARQGLMVWFPSNFVSFELAAWDTVAINNTKLGFSGKVFRILTWHLGTGGIDLTLQEESPAAYDWNAGEETTLDTAPDTDLPDPYTVAAPASLALASGTSQLFLKGDGTVFSRIKASWTAYTNRFVTDGGIIQVQYKKSADTEWESSASLAGTAIQTFILDVEDGVNYDVRVRAVNTRDVASAWSTVSAHTVVGKTAAPADVTNFVVNQSGQVINFSWDQVADLDLAGYEIRYDAQGASSWDDGTPLTEVTRGTAITNAFLPPGSWTCFIKAKDTSGNYSTNAASYDVDVIATGFGAITAVAEHPSWPGTLSNFIRHYTGKLVPDSQNSDSTDGWDDFDIFVNNPYATCTYEIDEIDIAFDDTIRAYAPLISALGPGESGSANPILQLDYKVDGGAYGGWQNWGIGNVLARYVKMKITLTTSVGVAFISAMTPTLDIEKRTESGVGVTIGASGTTITFDQRFHSVPACTAIYSGANAYHATVENETATGFDIHVYNSSGTEVGGIVNWTAVGS